MPMTGGASPALSVPCLHSPAPGPHSFDDDIGFTRAALCSVNHLKHLQYYDCSTFPVMASANHILEANMSLLLNRRNEKIAHATRS